MSFGFSIGDFLAVGKVIASITNSLREAGGSKSEYQELVRELESLSHALKHLDSLPTNGPSLESIKYAALSCRRPLEQFLGKIERYEKTLGIWGGANRLKKTADKLRWTFEEKDEIKKLQSYLNIHIGTINILLAEYGLERMNLASEKGDLDQLHIRERLENTRSLMQWIKDSAIAQTAVVQNNSDMLTKLFGMVSGELVSSLKSLSEMVAKVCVSTQQIYGIVLEIKGSLTVPDAKWSFFQAPFIVEDALGFKFPVPSEYDFGLLNAVIKHRFLEGPGSSEVQADNYELFSAKNSQVDFSTNVRLLPGISIVMAILLPKPPSRIYTDETCPMPRCGSILTTATFGGGRTCEECNVWFDHSKRRREFNFLLLSSDLENAASNSESSGVDNLEERSRKGPVPQASLDGFRNVKLAEQIEQPSQIDLDDKTIDFNQAISFINKIKNRFQGNPGVYKSFIEILRTFKQDSRPVKDVYTEVTSLFADAPDILEEFKLFLPESAAAEARIRSQNKPLEIGGNENIEPNALLKRKTKRARDDSTDSEEEIPRPATKMAKQFLKPQTPRRNSLSRSARQ